MGMEDRDWYREDFKRRQTIKAGKSSFWNQNITTTRKQLVIHFLSIQIGVAIGVYGLPVLLDVLSK